MAQLAALLDMGYDAQAARAALRAAEGDLEAAIGQLCGDDEAPRDREDEDGGDHEEAAERDHEGDHDEAARGDGYGDRGGQRSEGIGEVRLPVAH